MTTVKFILKEEGFREKPYLDTEGVATFGHGLTFITEKESENIVQHRIYDIMTKLESDFSWFRKLSEDRTAVIVSMVYQLGLKGFKGFKKMIKAIEQEDFNKASLEMLNSRWATQTPSRAKRQSEMMKNG